MATKLKNLVITKVALVDEGSCSAAHIKLFKRRGGNEPMELEVLLKLIPEDQREAARAAIEKLKTDFATTAATTAAAAAKLKAEEEAGTKIAALDGEIAKLKAPAEVTEEELMKNLDPAVKAYIEKAKNQAAAATAIVKKMKDEADDSEALAKAKELPNIGAKAEDLAKSFKILKNLNPEAFEQIHGVLKAANELISKGGSLSETGTSAEEDVQFAKAADAAWSEIEKKASDIQKAEKCSKEQSVVKVIKNNPELYKKYLDNLK